MPEHTMTALEFPGLLRVVQRFAVSRLGKGRIKTLTPTADFPAIQRKFQEIRELQDLESRVGELPLADFPGLGSWLARAAVPGSLLPPEAFNEILTVLRLARQVRLHLESLPPEAALVPLAARLHEVAVLRQAIIGAISPHNFILDGASPGLARARTEMAATRERLHRYIKEHYFGPQFKDAIQSPTVSQRNGRFVIALKADHRGAIPGIIHDQSQTRATLFLEPLAIVEQNNALNLLANEEKREEEAVLLSLTDLLRAYQGQVEETLAALAELDALAAKVRFAREFQAREPILRSAGGVDFREARHPLLLARQREDPGAPPVVPIDLKLTGDARFLIISGANAGGKTVALKTLGLLTLMIQSGLPVPVAEGSVFSPFDQVFADIGDPQDLHQSLSTFSAHLKRALAMLARLGDRSLILLDELGTATDPTEGGALALALLRAFHRRGAWGAVTTHLPLLKTFAGREPGFESVAVVFDEATRRPTYRLAYGVAGASNALTIARELGLAADILAEAEGYLDSEELKAYRLLAEVEAAQERLSRREAELADREAELARERAELARQRRELAETRRRLLEEVQAQARAKIRQAEAEFKEILKRLRQREQSWGRLRQELSARAQELVADLTPPEVAAPEPVVYAPGDRVFLPALNLTGEVVAPGGKDGRLAVRVRQVKLKVRPEEVTPAGGGSVPAGRKPAAYHVAPERLPSLNLVGLRVEEALPLVDRLLDQAILHGQERVDIIHGTGTGRLKAAIHEHLKHHAAVKAIHGEINPGVTEVELKE
jgi:DNA mismatch repair protein MutS2